MKLTLSFGVKINFILGLGLAILVGVGPGAACTTRGVLGLGVPQVTGTVDCAAARDFADLPVFSAMIGLAAARARAAGPSDDRSAPSSTMSRVGPR